LRIAHRQAAALERTQQIGTSTSRLPSRSVRLSGRIMSCLATSSIQSKSAEMNRSAGAPLSICLASGPLAA